MAEETESSEVEESSGGGLTTWLIPAAALLLVAAVSAGGTFFMLKSQAPPPPADLAEDEPVAAEDRAPFSERIFSIDPFVVNVTGEGYPRYLKVAVAFEMDTPEAREEIETRVAQVRDTTILLLSSKQLSEISAFEGKALLKDDLMLRVNGLLDTGRVDSVLFTEFVVQ
jgi:flagellar basal body-associated protein FliL